MSRCAIQGRWGTVEVTYGDDGLEFLPTVIHNKAIVRLALRFLREEYSDDLWIPFGEYVPDLPYAVAQHASSILDSDFILIEESPALPEGAIP